MKYQVDHVLQTISVLSMFSCELVRIGILENKVPGVEAGDGPNLTCIENVLLMLHLHYLQDDWD